MAGRWLLVFIISVFLTAPVCAASEPPIITAAKNGQADVVQRLVQSGANLKVTNERGSTDLHFAALKGHTRIVGMLLDAGLDKERFNKPGFTPLMLAAIGSHHETIKLLLNRGANIEAKSMRLGFTALILAAQHGKAPSLQLLIEKGAHVNAQSKDNVTAIYMAAIQGRPNVIPILAKAGAKVNAKISIKVRNQRKNFRFKYLKKPHTPLQRAFDVYLKPHKNNKARVRYEDTITALLENGADPRKRLITGSPNTLLATAISLGHFDWVAAMLKAGADVDRPKSKGIMTPLMTAAHLNKANIARLLLESGANVNAVVGNQKYRFTALYYAASKGYRNMIRLLLNAGAGRVIPMKARQLVEKSNRIFKNARMTKKKFKEGFHALLAAANIAPDYADVHYNKSLYAELVKSYGNAYKSLARYYLLKPNAPDRAFVEKKLKYFQVNMKAQARQKKRR